MGDVPEWYTTIRAAKYLGVAPWELQKQPIAWKNWALSSEKAEIESQRQQQESQNRKKG